MGVDDKVEVPVGFGPEDVAWLYERSSGVCLGAVMFLNLHSHLEHHREVVRADLTEGLQPLLQTLLYVHFADELAGRSAGTMHKPAGRLTKRLADGETVEERLK